MERNVSCGPNKNRGGEMPNLVETTKKNERCISRQNIEFIIKATGRGLWWSDWPEGESYWSRQVKEHFWLDENEHIAVKELYELLHPDDREPFRRKISVAVTEQNLFDFTCRTMSPDGRLKWIRVIAQPCRESENLPARLLGTTQDLTEQKLLEDELQKSEERFRAFMDNSPTTVWMKDEQGRYLYLNVFAEKSLGVGSKQSLGKTDQELFASAKAQQFNKSDLAVLKTGHVLELIEDTTYPDGTPYRWWKLKFLFKDAEGEPYVGGIGLDITERRFMEEELSHKEKTLTSVLLATLSGMGFIRDHVILWVNEQLSELTGYSGEELNGKNERILYETREEFDRVSAIIDKGFGSERVGAIETCWKRKDGSTIDIKLRFAAVKSHDPGNGYVLAATMLKGEDKLQIVTDLRNQ
jgi:PAS domain S-box-containing protein